jgi:hypothetical protein
VGEVPKSLSLERIVDHSKNLQLFMALDRLESTENTGVIILKLKIIPNSADICCAHFAPRFI